MRPPENRDVGGSPLPLATPEDLPPVQSSLVVGDLRRTDADRFGEWGPARSSAIPRSSLSLPSDLPCQGRRAKRALTRPEAGRHSCDGGRACQGDGPAAGDRPRTACPVLPAQPHLLHSTCACLPGCAVRCCGWRLRAHALDEMVQVPELVGQVVKLVRDAPPPDASSKPAQAPEGWLLESAGERADPG
jgi:hypothetical protein